MTQTSPKPSDQNTTNGYNNGKNGHGDIFDSNFDSKIDFTQPNLPTRHDAFAKPESTSAQLMPMENKNLSAWQRTSLRTKATLAAIAVGIIPLIGVGAVDYFLSSRSIRADAVQANEAISQSLGNEVSRFMFERYGDIQILSNLAIFTDANLSKTLPVLEKEAQLERFVQAYGSYDGIGVYDLNGNAIAQSKGARLGNIQSQGYFQEVIKSDRPVITQPTVSTVTKKPSIFFAAPIKDTITGKTVAVVRTRMPVDVLDKILGTEVANTSKDNRGIEYHLIDAEGKFFVATEKDQVGRDAKADFANFDKLRTDNQVKSLVTVDKIDNAEQLISYAPVTQAEGLPNLNWSILTAEDTTDAFAAQRQLLWILLIGTGLTALLVSAIAAYLARRATRPILEATNTVEKLGRGELDNRVDVSGGDEIAVLGANINRMADTVQELIRQQEIESEQVRLFADISSTRADNAQDVDGVFNQALAGAQDILKADRVVVYRFKPNWSGYIANESVSPGFPQALNDRIEDPCIGDVLIEAYKNGRVVATNNVFEADFHPDHLQLMERLQIMANLVTPIINNNELYGLLIAHHCTAPHQWEQTEINFLQQMSERLGAVLSRVSFLERKEAEATRSALLKDITVSIGQSLSSEDIFSQAVELTRRAIKSDRVVIYSFNDKWQGTVTSESVGEGWPKTMGAKIDDPCFADKYVNRYKSGRVQATNNIYKAGLTDCYLNQLSIFAVQANLVAPILRGDDLLGLLIAHQCSGPRNWEQADIDLFSQLATQVGFALDRANLLDQQKSAKEFLQKRALELLIEVDPLSRGDLTIRANVTEDEIGTVADSYNSTISSLRKIVTQVQQAAIQVAATTTDNQGSVQGLSFESLRQIEEIASALEQLSLMTTSIRAVAANASQAEAAVQRATETVQDGDRAMNRTVDGILAIRETVAETSKKVKRLGESSQKISKVVNLIGSFADQTNLLALNASIEAAHAGEQGRGFAVVADEVRVLARQSAAATAEIEALVKDIQTETNEVVAAMEAGTEQVVTGTRLVDETRQSLNKITAVSTEISQLVAAIASAAVAQSKASESVTSTMTGVATIAEATSTEASNVSTSFTQLLAVAQDLQTSVGQFKVK